MTTMGRQAQRNQRALMTSPLRQPVFDDSEEIESSVQHKEGMALFCAGLTTCYVCVCVRASCVCARGCVCVCVCESAVCVSLCMC